MSTRNFWIWVLLVAAADLVFAFWSYGQMPEQVPTHWNIEGKPDAWGSRSTYLWIGPGLVGFGVLLALALPYLSPPKFKIEPFRETFYAMMLFVIMLMVFIHAMTAYGALNPGQQMGNWLVAGICVFFSLIGNLMGRIKPNFYAGIRTPWTLSNEEVWRRTHRFGGRLFFFGGIVGALLAGFNLLVAALVVILAVSFTPVFYSFFVSKSLESESTPMSNGEPGA